MTRTRARSLAATLSVATLAALSVGSSTPASAQINDLSLTGFVADSQDGVDLVDRGNVFTALWLVDSESGGTIVAFSLDIDSEAVDEARYAESDWADALLDATTMERVNWILSIFLDGQAVVGGSPLDPVNFADAYRAGLTLHGFAEDTADELSAVDLIAGVQAAIWHFTNDVDISDTETPAIKALFEFLTGPANAGLPEPMGSDEVEISITPDHLSGQAGTPIGPFTVSTNVGFAEVNALSDGVGDPLPVRGHEGEEFFVVADGEALFIDIPADAGAGAGSITAAVNSLFTGRALISDDDSGPLVVLDGGFFGVFAYASVDWTASGSTSSPSPTDSARPTPQPSARGGALPATGAGSTAILVVVGAVLLAGGVALVIAARRFHRTPE